jgi:hypothetical protein
VTIADPQASLSLRDQLASSIPQLLSVIAGGCIAFVSSWATNRASFRRSREQYAADRIQAKNADRRAKGEELFVLIQHWMNGLSSNYLTFNGVMKRRLTYNQALDITIEAGNKLSLVFNPARMELLIDVYFPDCKVEYKAMTILRKNLNAVHAEFKRSYENNEERGDEFLSRYVVIQKDTEAKFTELQAHLIAEIRNIE